MLTLGRTLHGFWPGKDGWLWSYTYLVYTKTVCALSGWPLNHGIAIAVHHLNGKSLDSPAKLTQDWYATDSWPISHRQLTDMPPTVDRYTTDSWPIYHRQLTDISPTVDRYTTDIWSIFGRDASTKYRPILGRWFIALGTECRSTLARQSTTSRSTVGRWSIDRRATVERLSIDCRSTIDRYSVDRYSGRYSSRHYLQ